MEMNLFVWFAPRTMWAEASPFISSTFARLTHAPRGGECDARACSTFPSVFYFGSTKRADEKFPLILAEDSILH